MRLFIYLVSIFFFKTILVFLICFTIKIIKNKLFYFCLIQCRFEVWKTKTNLIFVSSMVFVLFLLFSVLFLIFCHLFFNFLLKLFYSISLFCFMFKCFKKFLIVKVFFCFYFFYTFFPFKKNIFCFFLFCYNFVSFYLFINNLSSSFLI
jgi:hypothetical protein